MNKSNGKDQDWLGEGFHRLDEDLIERRPPKIQWGMIYKGYSDEQKVAYLEKLAAAMNHAAYLIQNERNQLGELCERKEAQLESMKKALEENNSMIQGQITEMNAERQHYNKSISDLKSRVRELERGDHG